MRVAIDAGPLLDSPTGVGRYVSELSSALERRGIEIVRFAVALRGSKNASIRRWRVPAKTAQSLWQRFDWPSIESLCGPVDVVHGTNFVLPSIGRAGGIVTIHDLSFMRDDTFPGGDRLRSLVPWSARRADRVLVPTDAVADEVSAELDLARALIAVTPEGVSEVFFGATPLGEAALASLGIHPPFALAVGTLEPRKNLPRLLAAWAQAGLDGWTLVLAGPRGWGPGLPATPGVVRIGWVGDDTLPGLLAASSFFCYVSLYEGFGLPPLEAMAAGVPALVGRYSAAPEVVGDAARLVDPLDVEDIAGGLLELSGDRSARDRYARKGRARATDFTWDRTAALTAGAYADIQ